MGGCLAHYLDVCPLAFAKNECHTFELRKSSCVFMVLGPMTLDASYLNVLFFSFLSLKKTNKKKLTIKTLNKVASVKCCCTLELRTSQATKLKICF